MRGLMMFLVILWATPLGLASASSEVKEIAGDVCQKNDFPAFFRFYAEAPEKIQFEYIKWPLKTVGNDGDTLGYQQKNNAEKMILSAKELQEFNRKNKATYNYHLKKEGRGYFVMLALKDAGFDEGYTFEWENNCWKLTVLHENDTGI